jgi:hypothetical protein
MGFIGIDAPSNRPAETRKLVEPRFEQTTTEFGSAVTFLDAFGRPCTVRTSAYPDRKLLWFSVNETGQGAYLTREVVACLLPHLERFTDTGDLR